MKLFIVILCLLISVGSATAEIEKSVAVCAAMSGELERLNCYDQVASDYHLDKPIQSTHLTEGAGKWQISDSVNPIDDSRTVVLMLTADSGINSMGKPVRLLLRCDSNETEAYIAWQEYLGDDADVVTRIGRAKARTDEWSVSTNKKATFYPGYTVSFIRSLFGEDSFVAQVTPYNESPVTAIFDIRGLLIAAKPLMEACGWDPGPASDGVLTEAECSDAEMHLNKMFADGQTGTPQYGSVFELVDKCTLQNRRRQNQAKNQ